MTTFKPRLTGRKRKPLPITLATWEGPTALRIRRAIEADADAELAVEQFSTDAGEQTQLKRMRIVSPLERLWKAGVIDSGQYGAARRYQRDADLAAVTGPAASVRYEARTIQGGSERFLLPIEKATDYLTRLAEAQMACGPKRRRVLDWIAHEPCGAREQARLWFPDASELWARSSLNRLLRATCSILEAHYRHRRAS